MRGRGVCVSHMRGKKDILGFDDMVTRSWLGCAEGKVLKECLLV